MSSKDFLLILMPWTPDPAWVASLGMPVESRKIGMYQTELPSDISPETWAKVTILFTWKSFPTKEMVPNLKYCQLLSAGCNQILGLPLFEETAIDFCTSNGTHPPQIAEWVFSTFLAFQHHIPEYLDNQKESKWIDPPSDEDTEDSVGLRVGILGYGCVGRQVAHVAKAFGMSVHAYTLHPRLTPESRKDDSFTEPGLGDPNGEYPSKWFYGKDQLDDFLASDLDLLVITLPLTDQTKGMISREQFQLLSKKKTYVSNAGRGAVINTEDLVDALDGGLIRGAALDVTDPEPLPAEHKLWKYKNVIIAPHCAGNSNHYYERVRKILVYNLERCAKGQKLVNIVRRSERY
ncbi:D-2-hydroxyacid dehydrogenase [Colletotrichum siamense]|uniref:D-2-hydroxyacid dehydrogenase n=1 Tax=Colletotrichum siamense TaxID=690259 RepID=UPI0018723706|nr:D-2-hydroxyacid dehydrogenase [Colletotrichum siamense]KAF5489845.1 D-2-hydroxyacid dehydrogenase [Colletotrichum siamense]